MTFKKFRETKLVKDADKIIFIDPYGRTMNFDSLEDETLLNTDVLDATVYESYLEIVLG